MAAARLLFFLSVLVTLPVPGRAVERLDIVGTLGYHVTQSGEVLAELAVQHDLGYVELRAANPGVVSWFPEIGTRLVLPKAHILPAATRRGIVVNLAEMRLYFFPPDGAPIQTYPVGIGREAFKTPLGGTEVVSKRVNPTWVPPPSVRAEKPDLPRSVPPGPDNPLGAYSLDLGWPAYRIHGTNKPLGVGRRISHGCLRMYPWDIETLFPHVPVGTPVTVVDQPFKVGWLYGELYLEVHPSQRQADDVEITGDLRPEPLAGLIEAVRVAAGTRANQVDWPLVRFVAAERRGYPIRVTTPTASPGKGW